MRRLLVLVLALGLTVPGAAAQEGPTQEGDPLPRVPPGFLVTPYAVLDGTPVSLDWGPTSDPYGPAEVLYVADNLTGEILVIEEENALVGTQPRTFASGFNGVLGVVVAEDGTVFVADSTGTRSGPFGSRNYGRVWRVRDTDQDGVADQKQVVLEDLPNGRHNTNGMALGPDGLLYVTNGNSTDDGVLGGAAEVLPWSGSVVRVDPNATGVSVTEVPRDDILIATGMRNLFDVEFSPFDPTHLFIPTNGVDDAGGGATPGLEDSDDVLYRTDIDDMRQKVDPETGEPLFDEDGNPILEPVIDDFGFPSCFYNSTRQGNLEPYDNPNPNVISRFGPCPVDDVPRPMASFGLHVSADGLAFQRGDAWGERFENDLFVAEFGNFFGDEVVGHEVVRVEFSADGERVERIGEFVSGAAPLDVTFDEDGDLYIADFAGAVYKVQQIVDVPQTIEVEINAFQYIGGTLAIPEGTTIRWTNRETVLGVPHNVRAVQAVTADGASTGTEIDGPDLPVGESHSFTFEEPGTWNYTCTINAQHTALMHGQITVVPAGG